MTNSHEAADLAHVLAQQAADLIERQLHDAIQALDNRAALADQLEDLVRWQRAEIGRLKAERNKTRADADTLIERQYEVIARLEAENANLSAHLETAATERDELMRRVMKTEQNRNEGQMTTRPTIVCICGSTRFYEAFQLANYQETMAGKIVLSVGFYPYSQEQAHGEDVGCTPEQKEALDQLHLRKIDLADEILVLNVGGYIGDSTRRELAYATKHGKRVRFLEEQHDGR